MREKRICCLAIMVVFASVGCSEKATSSKEKASTPEGTASKPDDTINALIALAKAKDIKGMAAHYEEPWASYYLVPQDSLDKLTAALARTAREKFGPEEPSPVSSLSRGELFMKDRDHFTNELLFMSEYKLFGVEAKDKNTAVIRGQSPAAGPWHKFFAGSGKEDIPEDPMDNRDFTAVRKGGTWKLIPWGRSKGNFVVEEEIGREQSAERVKAEMSKSKRSTERHIEALEQLLKELNEGKYKNREELRQATVKKFEKIDQEK